MSKKKKRVRMEYGLYSLGIREVFQAFWNQNDLSKQNVS